MHEYKQIGSDWFHEEVAEVQLPDTRLKRRLNIVGSRYCRQFGIPIGLTMGDPSSARAAYRLFNNPTIESGDILAPHLQRSAERMSKEKTVVCAHDSMVMGFSSHKKMKGLGTIGGAGSSDLIKQNGILSHHAMAFSEKGLPLGILSQETLARRLRPERRKINRGGFPAEDKESYRWLVALVNAQRLAGNETTMIHVADREADFFPFMAVAKHLETKFVIRAQHDRRITDSDKKTKEFLQEQDPVACKKIVIPGNGSQKTRTAYCEIRFVQMTLCSPDRQGYIPLEVSAISIKEVNSETSQSINWYLFTNLKLQNVNEVLQAIKYYTMRWGIEEYHKILKSGMKVEECRLQKASSFSRFLELMMIMAWRVFWITKIARTEPDKPSNWVLCQSELKSLFILSKKQYPEFPPDVLSVVLMIAKLGGHYQVTGRPPPGPTVIWRGWVKLMQFMEAVEQFQAFNKSK